MHENHFKKSRDSNLASWEQFTTGTQQTKVLKIHFPVCFFRVPVVPAVESSKKRQLPSFLGFDGQPSDVKIHIELRRRKRDQILNPQNICFRQ